jgi:hypothetical protein
MVTLSVVFAFAPVASLTEPAMENCPAVVGVPVIAPEEEERLNPSGNPEALKE